MNEADEMADEFIRVARSLKAGRIDDADAAAIKAAFLAGMDAGGKMLYDRLPSTPEIMGIARACKAEMDAAAEAHSIATLGPISENN